MQTLWLALLPTHATSHGDLHADVGGEGGEGARHGPCGRRLQRGQAGDEAGSDGEANGKVGKGKGIRGGGCDGGQVAEDWLRACSSEAGNRDQRARSDSRSSQCAAVQGHLPRRREGWPRGADGHTANSGDAKAQGRRVAGRAQARVPGMDEADSEREGEAGEHGVRLRKKSSPKRRVVSVGLRLS